MRMRLWRTFLPPSFLKWMATLLPQQKSSGAGAVHIGQVNGNVTNVTNKGPSSTGGAQAQPHASQVGVHLGNGDRPVTMHVTNVFYSAQVQAQPAANTRPTATTVSNEQREVLALLRHLPEDAKQRVHEFMKKKYGTKMVIEVDQTELRNLKRYIEVTLQNCQIERSKSS